MLKARVLEEIKNYLKDEMTETKDAERAAEIQRLLLIYQHLPHREYSDDDQVIPSALVQLALGELLTYCFVSPQGGGLVTRVDGQPVQVVTPYSPLGEAIMGKKVGDQVRVELRGSAREYRIVSIR